MTSCEVAPSQSARRGLQQPSPCGTGIATLGKLNSISAWNLLRERARRFREFLEPTLRKYAGRFLFSQLESIFTFTFTREAAITRLGDVKGADMKLFADFHREMLRRGVYLAPSGYEVGFLSTAHTEDDLAKTASAVAESLDEVL